MAMLMEMYSSRLATGIEVLRYSETNSRDRKQGRMHSRFPFPRRLQIQFQFQFQLRQIKERKRSIRFGTVYSLAASLTSPILSFGEYFLSTLSLWYWEW